MKKRLLKDIVIPAGTIFNDESGRKSEFGTDVFGTLIGLTKDSYGELIYMMDDDTSLNEWFEDV